MELTGSIVFLFASYFAATAATLAGFGSSTLLIPVAIIFMDVKTAVFLVACFHLFNNSFKVKAFYRKIDFRTFMLFGVPSILFAFAGALLISVLPVEVIKKAIAIFLMAYSLYSLGEPTFNMGETKLNAIVGGICSGFFAGLIGLGGAVRSAFLIGFALPKDVYVGTSAMIAFVIDLTRIPTYMATRIVQDTSSHVLLPFLVGTAYLGVRTGKLLLERISQERFRKFVLVALFIVGLTLLSR